MGFISKPHTRTHQYICHPYIESTVTGLQLSGSNFMMTSSNGNISRVIGPLCGEFTGHRSPLNSSDKGQWRGALMFSVICAWINGWVNNREAGDLIHHRAHYDVIVMWYQEKAPWYATFVESNLGIHGYDCVNHTYYKIHCCNTYCCFTLLLQVRGGDRSIPRPLSARQNLDGVSVSSAYHWNI